MTELLCIIRAKNGFGRSPKDKSIRDRHNGPSLFMPSLFLCDSVLVILLAVEARIGNSPPLFPCHRNP